MVDATLVTVHGFWSSPATWDRLHAVWQADGELEPLQVHGFGYPSPKMPRLPLSRTRVPDLDDLAQILATEYTTALRNVPSVAFVTHSQGGLILQRFLAWMVDQGRARELARIRTIVMLACPNTGSQYLALIRRPFGYGRHPQAADLEAFTRRVADTHRAVLGRIVYASGADEHHCRIPFHVYAGGSDAIVSAASAQAAFPEAGTLAGGHSSILDPAAPGNRTADVVKDHILTDLTERAPAQAQEQGAAVGAGPAQHDEHGVGLSGTGTQGLQVGARSAQVNVSLSLSSARSVTQALPPEPTESSADVGPRASTLGHAVSRGSVTYIPPPVSGFRGREQLLARVRETFASGNRGVVQVLHGMPGVGKTLIATAYSNMHEDDYDVLWWLDAGQADVLAQKFTELAEELGRARPGMPGDAIKRAVRIGLQERGNWLLVFDNVEDPGDVTGWLPGGNGHVLITSRSPRGWEEVAAPVAVDVFDRAESVAILRERANLRGEEADQVAHALGDLPLAVAQAAGYLSGPGITAADYLSMLRDRAPETLDLDRGTLTFYKRTVTATVKLALEKLGRDNPASAELAVIRAFLSQEPVPFEWFRDAAAQMPPPLGRQAADLRLWSEVLHRLDRSALARADKDGLWMHSLTRTIIPGVAPAEQEVRARAAATALLASRTPGDTGATANWPAWAQLVPHILALRPGDADSAAFRQTAADAARYLTRCGQYQPSHDLALSLYDKWGKTLGLDDPQTLLAARALGDALRGLGRYEEARNLDEDSRDRYRRVNGENHVDTLNANSNLGIDYDHLAEPRKALELHQECWCRAQREFGLDDPNTLVYANNLAIDLLHLGRAREALDLDMDTLQRRLSVLGEEHIFTLKSASNIVVDLRKLGSLQEARVRAEGVLSSYRRILGESHLDTIRCIDLLADILLRLGDYEAAWDLYLEWRERRQITLGDAREESLLPTYELGHQVALGRLKCGRREAAAAVFPELANESPNDGRAHNDYGFCLLPSDPEAALGYFAKASRLPDGNKLITLANTVLALHLLGRDAEAIALGSSATAPVPPETKGWMWLINTDHELQLSSGTLEIPGYLRMLVKHIESSCGTTEPGP